MVGSAVGRIELTTDEGATWDTVLVVPPSDVRANLALDLADYLGETIRVRFVLDVTVGGLPGLWLIEDVQAEKDRRQPRRGRPGSGEGRLCGRIRQRMRS